MVALGEVAAVWWGWMAPMALQVAVLVAVVAVLDGTLLRRAWPQLRVAVWSLVWFKLLLPPTVASPVAVAEIGLGGPGPGGGASGWAGAAMVLWAAGAGSFALVGARRYAALRRRWLRAASTPGAAVQAAAAAAGRVLGLRRLPRLVLAPDLPGPAVLGVFRPVVALPADWVPQLSRAQLEHVLLHELAHVARRDPWIGAATAALHIAYWFHPAVWWAQRRCAVLREMSCDQTVAAALGDRTPDYRRTLLQLAGAVLLRPAPALGLLGPRGVVARLAALERGPCRSPRSRRAATLALTTMVLACCVPLGRVPPVPLPRAAAAFVPPPLEELRGCLQLRYAVFAAMAADPPVTLPRN